MRAFIQRHLTYANVMATMAVFIALGGSAIAARYVITRSSQIKNGAVTGADVKDSSLAGADIKNKSLTASDFKGSIQGKQGVQGPPGVQGLKGDPGLAGPAGTARAYGYVKSDGTILSSKSKNLTASKVTAGLGTYCVSPTPGSGIDPRTVNPVATADYLDGGGFHHIVQSSAAGDSTATAECPGGWLFLTDDMKTPPARMDIGFTVLVP